MSPSPTLALSGLDIAWCHDGWTMVKPVDDAAWQALLASQNRVVSRPQCRAHGISDDAVRHALRRGDWCRLGVGVYLAGSGPASTIERCWAGLLAVGGFVVISHESTLWLNSVLRSPPARVHLGVLDSRYVRPPEGCVVHHLADLGEQRVLWSAQPPRTRVEQAVLDIIRQCDLERDVVDLLTRAVQSGATTADRLGAAAADRPRLRHRRLINEILGDVGEGAQSPLEIRDLRNDRLHGLPLARRQVERVRGRRRERLDVVYSGSPLVRPLVKELDGRLGHAELEGVWRDMDRDNASEARGESHLRFGWRDLVHRPCEVAAQVAMVLRVNGWRGAARKCSAECAVR